MAQPLDIAIVVPGLSFDGNTIKTKGLGGSETAAYYMAKELVAVGNRVTMFTQIDQPMHADGVLYMPMAQAQTYTKCIPHDVTIVQRQPEYFSAPTNSKLNILWCHDLAYKRNENKFKSPLWNIDKVFTVSKWHKEQWQSVYDFKDQDDLFYVTRNGIDYKLIADIRESTPKKPKQIVYGARPERGLDNLIDSIFEKILSYDKDITLVVPTYDVGLPDLQSMYNQMFAQAKQKFGERVRFVGSLSKSDLYKLYCESAAYVYPTPGKMDKKFAEVSCISAMEAMACGLPVITSDRGALSETLARGAGILLSGDPWSESYANQFAAAVNQAIESARIYAAQGIIHAQKLDWSFVAQNWSEQFEKWIRENNNDKTRLFIDLWRNSDVMAAKTLIDDVPDYLIAKKDIQTNFEFLETDKFAEHYEKVNQTFHPSVIDNAKHQHRYKLLEQWMGHVKSEVKSVLDYACHDGAYTTNLAKVFPDIEFTGVDFNSKAINAANEFGAVNKATNANYFVVNDGSIANIEFVYSGGYGCLMMQEVLEHVKEPWNLVNEQEQYLRDNGFVYITVPFGPWEYDTMLTDPVRAHIWHFDRHDLYDMFKDKAELNIGASYHAECLEMPSPRGWWIVTYRKNGAKTNPINMDRKLWLQRPRQTVSLNVMAGKGSGSQSRWMLDSTKHIIDQYVVADTGMTDTDKQPWIDYGAKIVKAPDPKVHGFETPRNIGLSHCDMDWVLWLDTDEKLTDPKNIHKYLRPNIFQGYGIRQHHFAVDTTFSPDMPVRMFRWKTRQDGKKMRWVGMIHEHPETGVNEGPGYVVVLADTNIAHTGYLCESGRRERFFRNLPMLNKDAEVHPDRILQKHFIMRDSVQLAMYQLQENGGRLTDQIRGLCNDVVALYRKHFIGKQIYMAIDSQTWYSQALEILGEGFWASYTLEVNKDGVPDAIITRRKFANVDDFMIEMNAKLKAKTEIFSCDYL